MKSMGKFWKAAYSAVWWGQGQSAASRHSTLQSFWMIRVKRNDPGLSAVVTAAVLIEHMTTIPSMEGNGRATKMACISVLER